LVSIQAHWGRRDNVRKESRFRNYLRDKAITEDMKRRAMANHLPNGGKTLRNPLKSAGSF
jgi:hypothetical protein